MDFWVTRIRPIVFTFSAVLALAIYGYVVMTISPPALQHIQLVRAYAFTAVIYLYFALLASPLYAVLPNFPLRVIHIKARKAIGVSAFFFALLHGELAFYFLLGGFSGLTSLSLRYLIAISFSGTALFILSILALTSLRYFVVKLGPYWKRLHRFVYLAGVLVITHALLIGPDFADFSRAIPKISFLALLFLFTLEAVRFTRYLRRRHELKQETTAR